MANEVVSAIRRADQVFYEQVGEKITLEYGIAFFVTECPHAQQDNAFREVWVADLGAMPAAWAEVEAFYARRDLTCYRWVPALGQAAETIERFLLEKGLRKEPQAAMHLREWLDFTVEPNVRVLPARAMRQAFRALHEDPQHVAIEERRLDSPQFDVFVATVDNRPAGRCGLLQVGEIANVRDLYVTPEFRQGNVEEALLAHMLEMARRLMMRIVCAKVDVRDAETIAFLEHHGFRQEGEMVEYARG